MDIYKKNIYLAAECDCTARSILTEQSLEQGAPFFLSTIYIDIEREKEMGHTCVYICRERVRKGERGPCHVYALPQIFLLNGYQRMREGNLITREGKNGPILCDSQARFHTFKLKKKDPTY